MPAPRATNGTPARMRTRGRPPAPPRSSPAARRATGTTRCPVSPSHSYVRSCSGSSITAPGRAASTASTNARAAHAVSLYRGDGDPGACRRRRRFSSPASSILVNLPPCQATSQRASSSAASATTRSSRPTRSSSSPTSSATFGGRREELLAARTARQQRLLAGELPDFLEETREVRESDVAGRRGAARPPGPARRDHRPDRPEDGDQRAQLGRARLHGRLRGRELADLVEPGRGPAEPDRRERADDLARHRREELPPERRGRDAARAAARLAPARAARARRRRAGVGQPVRLRPVHVPLGQAGARARQRAVLLPAEAREPPRGAALERRLPARAGRARHPARDDPRDRPDRDDPRRVRDGGDPLRAARALGRAQRRPLGLHLQRDQEVPRTATTSSCPTARR